MRHTSLSRFAAAVTVALALTACGGTDGSSDPLGAGDESADRVIPGSGASEPDVTYAPGEEPGAGQGIAEGEPHPSSTDGAPTTDPTPREAAPAECSASGMMVAQVQPEGVSEAAAATYWDLRNAAMACDYDRLAELAAPGFTFSFGGGDDPAAYWAQAEADGDDPMAKLVEITGTEVAVAEDGSFVWPAVHVHPEDTDAWAAVEGVYASEILDEWREAGTGYLGYRLAISPQGEWLYFVAGD